jgi:hypothetical protein
MKKIFCLVVALSLIHFPFQAQASEALRVVISEINTSGGSGKTTDEFIELYNPTSTDVNLSGWQLIKKTASGSSYVLIENFGDKTIVAHSFFLIAHPTGYSGTTTPDIYYSTTNSISDNNTVILSDVTQAVIDEVGYGTATVFETEAAANPAAGKSLERKARADSTTEMMAEGGTHYFSGNGEDSDNNKIDFVTRDTPEAQNSASESEYTELAPPINQPAPTTPQSPQSAPVYSKNVIVNELFPNPKGADDSEFIELYNSGDQPVDLNGWKISDSTARKFIITPEDFKTTVITTRGFFIIDKKVSAISLNNTSDAAKLYSPDDVLVNSFEYIGCQEAKSYSLVEGKWVWTDEMTPGQANKSLIKNELPVAAFETDGQTMKVGAKILFDASDSSDADDDTLTFEWDFGDGVKTSGVKTDHVFQKAGKFVIRLTVKDSKGGEDEAEENFIITDYDYSNKLLINELLPACQGADEECEYIELFNPENRAVKLDGWRLVLKKSSFSFPAGTVIKSRSYLVINRKDSHLSLNNSGAKLWLVDPHEKIINGVEYGKAKDDLSFSRINSKDWQWTTKQTPGKPNEFVEEEEEVTAAMTNQTVKKAGVDLSAVITPLAEATEDKLGDTLKISAEVESTSGSNIYLVDEAGNSLRAYIQKTSGIKKPELKSGDKVEIIGVLDKTTAGLRLLPRKQEDIQVLASQTDGQVLGAATEKTTIDVPIKDSSKESKRYLIIGACLGGIASVVFLIKKIQKKTAAEKEEAS